MEQHVENVLKAYKQRLFRRNQLEKEMCRINLSEETQGTTQLLTQIMTIKRDHTIGFCLRMAIVGHVLNVYYTSI